MWRIPSGPGSETASTKEAGCLSAIDLSIAACERAADAERETQRRAACRHRGAVQGVADLNELAECCRNGAEHVCHYPAGDGVRNSAKSGSDRRQKRPPGQWRQGDLAKKIAQ